MTMLSHYGALGGAPAVYVEDVFSTYLYTGNNTGQTITNGIDLSTKGGMVWLKGRAGWGAGGADHSIYDTARGVRNYIVSNSTASQSTAGTGAGLTSFNSTGFTLGTNWNTENYSPATYASWTFRKQPKFFDIVTGTADSSGNVSFNHSLNSVPGCVIIKSTTNASDWWVYHRSLGNNAGIRLNLTNAQSSITNLFSATSTTFTANIGYGAGAVGYVAYLFAHDAGGFGASGADNVISCGSWTNTASSGYIDITLGYEPQWLLIKNTSTAENWVVVDNMRNWSVTNGSRLMPNLSDAEVTWNAAYIPITSTGFRVDQGAFGASGNTYIYIAIRRPMKTPTIGTSVFGVNARTGTGATGSSTSFGKVTDLTIIKRRNTSGLWAWTDRLRGATRELNSASGTTAETIYANDVTSFASNVGYLFGTGSAGNINASGDTYIDYLFQRAPGFFDEVCYTGNNQNPQNVSHNLTVVPELVISRCRSVADDWIAGFNFGVSTYSRITVNSTGAAVSLAYGSGNMFSSAPTSTQLAFDAQNTSPRTYVTYLFATCPGVSKVGSYNGNGTSQTINCGFTSGARFVLIKRTNAAGAWFVFDSARGINAGNDPNLQLNAADAEQTTGDEIDADSTGFIVNQTGEQLNASGGTYIFLAIS